MISALDEDEESGPLPSKRQRCQPADTLPAMLQMTMDHLENESPLVFKGIAVRSHPGTRTAFLESLPQLKESLMECMRSRFDDMEHDPKISCLKLINIATWPKEKSSQFGLAEMAVFIEHFGSLLTQCGADVTKVNTEWKEFLSFWQRNMTHLSSKEVFSAMKKHYSANFPNLMHVFAVLKVFPGVCTSIVQLKINNLNLYQNV